MVVREKGLKSRCKQRRAGGEAAVRVHCLLASRVAVLCVCVELGKMLKAKSSKKAQFLISG